MKPESRGTQAATSAAWLIGGVIAVVNFIGLIVGLSLGTEPAWFSAEVEQFGWIAAILLAVVLVGGTIAWFMANVGARQPGAWLMGIVFSLVCTQLTLISGVLTLDALTIWLSSTPHREPARLYSAGPVKGTARSPSCALKIAVKPDSPRFKGRVPSFCAPEAVVEEGLKQDDRVVLVGRAGALGFVVERVERAH